MAFGYTARFNFMDTCAWHFLLYLSELRIQIVVLFEASIAMLALRQLKSLLDLSLAAKICSFSLLFYTLRFLFDLVFRVDENSFAVKCEISTKTKMLFDIFRLNLAEELLHSLSNGLCTPVKLFLEVLSN